MSNQDERPTEASPLLEVAREYTRRKWSVIPIPFREKNPGFLKWEQMKLKEDNLPHHFNGQPQNIGVLLGGPSHWLIDVDLDHPRAVVLADQFLPPTPAVFGRPGKLRSHRLYLITAPAPTKKFKSKSAGMIVEFRSTGAQTVFPPSTHVTGEIIAWETPGAEPATVDPDILLEAVKKLAHAVKVELGEVAGRKAKVKTKSLPPSEGDDLRKACLAAILNMEMIDCNDGSMRLFAAACRAVEHGLDDADAVATIQEYARQKPFPQEWTSEQIIQRVRQAEQKTQRGKVAARTQRTGESRGDSGLPEIVVTNVQLRDVTDLAIEALQLLNDPPSIFARSGSLSRIVKDEKGTPLIQPLDKYHVRCELTKSADFLIEKKFKDQSYFVAVTPPDPLCQNILALPEWPFPPLDGIARAPIVRPDGTICTTQGYDNATALYYFPDAGLNIPEIPEHPNIHEVHACVDILLKVIADFPFANDASRTNALSLLFTILLRPVIPGQVPLIIFDAPMMGTGKTLLASLMAQIAVGEISGEGVPAKQNEDEWRKKITSLLMKSAQIILLDNIPEHSSLDSPALAAALTISVWSDRLLGTNETIRLPSRAVWVATGNNLRVAGDMPRRSYTVRLDAQVERPWDRGGFQIANIEEYVRTHRGDLLAAALTIIRGWFAAGRPKAAMRPFGSFEEWVNTVGSVLAYAGIEGFLDNLEETRAVQDEDSQDWAAFFEHWHEGFQDNPVSVAELYDKFFGEHAPIPIEPPEALLFAMDKGGGSLRKSLGKHLSRMSGRVINSHKLCDLGRCGHGKLRMWSLKPVE